MASLTANGLRKAAILMVVLGEEAAAALYRHLSDGDIQRITREIAELGSVPSAAVGEVLEEYYRLALTQEYVAQGGEDYAAKLLIKAFGEQGAHALLQQTPRAQELKASKLDSLRKADPQQLSRFLEGEHPQTIALILAHLDSKQGAALLMKLPEQIRAEAVTRLGALRQFSPEVAQKLSVALHQKLQALGEQSRRTYAGLKAVADLLNRLELPTAKAILEAMEQSDSKLAVNVRNLMFTFEDFISVPDVAIRELLAKVEKKTLAVALKGASEEVQGHLLKSMSSRAIEMLKEDMEALGMVRSKEVSKAQQEIVTLARQLEAEGKITLKMEGEDEYVV